MLAGSIVYSMFRRRSGAVILWRSGPGGKLLPIETIEEEPLSQQIRTARRLGFSRRLQGKHTLLAALVAALFVPPASAQDWIGIAGFGVEVKTGKGRALQGATVSVLYQGVFDEEPTGGPVPRATGAKGQVSFSNLALGAWSLRVEHPDHLSYVATVLLSRKDKPKITASFLEASGRGRNPIRVKVTKASGRDLGTPLRVAEKPAPKPSRPPEIARAQPSEPPKAPDPAPPTPPAPEVEPAPEPTPAEIPKDSLPAKPAPPEAPTPEPSVAREPEPAPPVPEPSSPPVEPTPEPDSESDTQPVPEPIETPAPEAPPVVEAQPEPTVLPAPEPEPVAPTPTTEPAPPAEPIAVPDPEPTIEAVEAAAPATPPAEVPEPTDTLPDIPDVAPQAPPPPVVEPPVMEPTIETTPPPATPPTPPVEPAPAPGVETAAPAAPSAAPPSTSPEPESEPEPEPEPAAMPLPDVPEGAVRSYRERSCVECKPGEWSAASAALAAAAGNGCPADALGRAEASVETLARRLGSALQDYAGPLLMDHQDPVLERLTTEDRVDLERSIGVFLGPESSCRLLIVAMPGRARISGFRYEALEDGSGADCPGDQPCPIGDARWLANPGIERSAGATLAWALFENTSADAERLGRMTGYFSPAGGWRPGS